MEKKDQKRHRSQNWIEEDKMLLQELIRKKVKEIENKNTDTKTNNAKKRAWSEVEHSFNSLCMGGQRNMGQLKSQWVATKVLARRMASRRKEGVKSGGEPQPSEIKINSDDTNIWLPNEFVIDKSEVDSDAYEEERVNVLHEEGVSDFSGHNHEEDNIFNQTDISPKSQNLSASEKTPPSFSIPITENVPAEESNSHSVSKRKQKARTDNCNSTASNITKLTSFDMKCRKELHELQVEVEKKRLRNLDRELDLIEEKIKYFKNKSPDIKIEE